MDMPPPCETLGSQVIHRCNSSLSNHLEYDHCHIKQREYSMRGCEQFMSASQVLQRFDEVDQYFRFRLTTKSFLSLPTNAVSSAID
jgi:transposase-like protein